MLGSRDAKSGSRLLDCGSRDAGPGPLGWGSRDAEPGLLAEPHNPGYFPPILGLFWAISDYL